MIIALLLLISGAVALDYNVNFLKVNREMEAYANRFVEDVGLPPFGHPSRLVAVTQVHSPCERSLYYKFIITPLSCKKLKDKSIIGMCLSTREDKDFIIEVGTKYGLGSQVFRQIFIHEIAHCYYGVKHTEEGGPKNALMAARLNLRLKKKQVDKLEQDLIVWIRNNYYSLKNGEIK